MKSPIIILITMFFSMSIFGQSTAVFTQQLEVNSDKKVNISLDHPYILLPTKKAVIKVEMHVTLHNGMLQTLEHLNYTGQYLVRLRKKGKDLKLTDNTRREKARINGAPVHENVRYVIYVPESIEVALN